MKKLVYTLAMIQVALCDLGRNIRTMVDEAEIRRMAESLKKRQIHPIIVMADGLGKFLVIDGGKRVRAALLGGIAELLAIVTDEPLTPEQIRELQLVAAFHRSDPHGIDQWQAMEAVKSAHADWTNVKIADHLDIDPKMVKVLLSPGLVVEAARDAFREGKIGISDCYTLSLHENPDEQKELLDKRLAGESRDAVAHESRQRRNGHGNGTVPAARAGRIRIPLASGVVITLAGEELSIEDAIRELTAALAKLRAAEKKKWDVKTFQGACRDEAAAG
jgi:ParB-like chromosome segregation protein Spo0J